MAYDVITGSASFSGLTLEEAQSATAVFQDAIARVAGVDIDRVTILSIELSARRRLTDTVVVNFGRSARRPRKEPLWMPICQAPRRTRH